MSPLIIGRKHVIKKLFVYIKKKRRAYEKQQKKYKFIECITESFLIFISSLSTTLLLISASTELEKNLRQNLNIVSTVLSSIVTIIGATKRGIDIRGKYENYLKNSLHFTELERFVNSEILKTYTEDELDLLIDTINTRLSMLEDNALPVSISSSRDLSV